MMEINDGNHQMVLHAHLCAVIACNIELTQDIYGGNVLRMAEKQRSKGAKLTRIDLSFGGQRLFGQDEKTPGRRQQPRPIHDNFPN